MDQIGLFIIHHAVHAEELDAGLGIQRLGLKERQIGFGFWGPRVMDAHLKNI